MTSATELANKLGVRSTWSKHAVWEGEGLMQELSSYPSIKFGNYRNNRVSVVTPNSLFWDPHNDELRTIDVNDLDWYELNSKTPLPDDELPFHQMAFTKILLDLADSEVAIAEFLSSRGDFQAGLHRDVRTMILKGKFKIYVMEPNAPPSNGKRYFKHFSLEPLARLWRTNYVSSRFPSYEPNGTMRDLFGGLGSPQKLTGLFFGQMAPSGLNGGWICFMRIELFEQLYKSWLDDMTGPVFYRFIEHCGLRIRKPQ